MQATITMQQEALPVIRSSIDLKRKALELNLRHYLARLTEFETQHHMSSKKFAAEFEEGLLGDDADWFEWDYVLSSYQETARQLEILNAIRL